MNHVTEYFTGEKIQCIIGIIISIVSIVLATYFLLQVKTDLFKGIAWPFLIISALLLTVCIGVVWRTPHDIERVSSFLRDTPEQMKTSEIPRMEKVMGNFKTIKTVEIILLIIGAGLVLFGQLKGNLFITGIGLGLFIQSALMFGFDYFAHERGKEYLEFLIKFRTT